MEYTSRLKHKREKNTHIKKNTKTQQKRQSNDERQVVGEYSTHSNRGSNGAQLLRSCKTYNSWLQQRIPQKYDEQQAVPRAICIIHSMIYIYIS